MSTSATNALRLRQLGRAGAARPSVASASTLALTWLLSLAVPLAPWPGIALAQSPAAPAAQAGTKPVVGVELNRLETIDGGCRLYVVVTNESDVAYAALQLDLALFRPDGIVDQRFFVDLAPIKKQKRTVKLFELANVKCADVGSLLINDVLECRDETAKLGDCLARLNVTSLASVKLYK